MGEGLAGGEGLPMVANLRPQVAPRKPHPESPTPKAQLGCRPPLPGRLLAENHRQGVGQPLERRPGVRQPIEHHRLRVQFETRHGR